jgi:hypothetical protein
MMITPLFTRSSFLLKVIVFFTNVDYPIVCPFVSFSLRFLCVSPLLFPPLFVRSSLLLMVIVFSTYADYPLFCPFVLFTLGYCVFHQCWLPHCLSIRLFYLRLLCCPPMLITPLFVRSSFLLKIIVLSPLLITPLFVRSSFLLKIIVNTIALSKRGEWTNNGVINIDEKHNNLK